MSNVSHGIDLLVAAANVKEYGASRVGEDTARLEGLNLFVAIRETQTMSVAGRCAFMSEVTASSSRESGEPGIIVTCVGMGPDMESAVADAVGQWALGVLPVLAQWRGKHDCLPSTQEIETKTGKFTLIAGPLVARGIAEGDTQPAIGEKSLMDSLMHLLKVPADQLHWLEMYASKFNDGSIEATCRINNHDWLSGQMVLKKVAEGWPVSAEPMQSSRQFALIVPHSGKAQEIRLPSFWSRVMGRA